MFDTKSTNRLGNDGFIWFIGVVEDIDDPQQLGRLKVRVLGDHTQSLTDIPTDDLPWAYLINDPKSSSMQGIGDSPTGLYVKGAWVFGFYWDGKNKQQPVISGTFGGIPESIPFKPKAPEQVDNEAQDTGPECGFQDPDQTFPMGHHIFEQDTNRLARNAPSDHAFEIPEALVPEQEKMIESGLCPKKPVYGKKYYDKFDEAYVRKFGQGEDQKAADNDAVLPAGEGQVQLKVEDKEDETCQYFIMTNNHPFTIYKFINKERFVPIAKPFADPMHREVWHEPENPWNAKYPYNKVWEGYHKVGTTTINNPKNQFVSESYGYDKTIENYDGSEKEGIYRKQSCGIGSWGLGEEWDSTEGAQRYHRFTPSGNYFEIDNDGNEVRKIYGTNFEINVADKTILIKGDWNVTVEGDKNELIEGDYNLQVMGNFNTDVRTDIETHTDGEAKYHYKGNHTVRTDSNERRVVSGSRNTSILVDDYTESQTAERRADTIHRKGASEMIDEAFLSYEFKAHDAKYSICNIIRDVETIEERIQERTTHLQEYNEFLDTYNGCVRHWEIHTEDFEVYYSTTMLMELAPFTCVVGDIEEPDVGQSTYTETDGISKCLAKYYECIEAAKGACTTTLKDPRTLEDYTRFDWEKYHASVESCKKSYEQCIAAQEGQESDVCNPTPGSVTWECFPSHDPNCKVEDKQWTFYKCNCECDGPQEEKFIDPWEDIDQDTP